MCQVFLERIFDVVCNDLFLGEENRSKTVMHAYMDALYGKTGRAEEYKIHPVVHSEEKLVRLLKGQEKIRIFENGREEQARLFAERVRKAAETQGMEPEVEIFPGHALDPRYGSRLQVVEEDFLEDEDSEDLTFTMTEDVFRLKAGRLGLTTCYVDAEGRIVSSKEDTFLILGIPESRRLFLLSQKDLFFSAVKNMHP